MAYTDLDPFIYVEAPATTELFQAIADNFTAVAEGESGAPSILTGIANLSAADGLGTYVLATHSGGAVTYGATVAGATLTPSSAANSVRVDSSGAAWDATATLLPGSALSGTWRCMGSFDDSASGGSAASGRVVITGITLWLRIL